MPPRKNKTEAAAPELSFEESIGELDQLIVKLESGQLPLNEAMSAYQRGATLLQNCQRTLTQAEGEMQILEGNLLQSFNPEIND
ncbi:MAG: exodeoxyribonuclease VII small subunit [Pseudomonadota bacterium]